MTGNRLSVSIMAALAAVGVAVVVGVVLILADDTAGYGVTNVDDANCNDGQDPTVAKGGSFDCQVTVNGVERQAR